MDIFEQARLIVEGATIEDKLYPIKNTKLSNDSIKSKFLDYKIGKNPGRTKKIEFSSQQLKFPSRNKLATNDGAGLALHFFANHELLAIEMMSLAILKFPVEGDRGDKLRGNLIATIRDEQKHFSLYCERMKDFGIEFGDYPLNDFFWRQVHECSSVESFYAMMALTFESANLDFAAHYRDLFANNKDHKTAGILSIVLEDEIRHVNIGWDVLNKSKSDKKMWEYYLSLLPEKITPARAKGNQFLSELRLKSGMSKEFTESLKTYKGNFKVTQRKDWD